MPSTTSSSVSRLLASSTVITPSLPTLSIASEIILPIALSPLAEIAPTCAISSDFVTLRLCFESSATIASTAASTPRLTSIGFAPAATALTPSFTIACAMTVAVVVPSPAMLLCFEATSRTICAPMFSNLSASSISLATVTPSLLTRGAPHDFSITTLRPLGPSVTLTALARTSMPRSMRSRASCENLTSLAAMTIPPVRDLFLMATRPAPLGLSMGPASPRVIHNPPVRACNLHFRARAPRSRRGREAHRRIDDRAARRGHEFVAGDVDLQVVDALAAAPADRLADLVGAVGDHAEAFGVHVLLSLVGEASGDHLRSGRAVARAGEMAVFDLLTDDDVDAQLGRGRRI